MLKDPICGMEVVPEEAFAKREYMGQTFYFCSQNCVEKFDSKSHLSSQPNGNPPHQHSTNGNSGRAKTDTASRIELPVSGLQKSGTKLLEEALTHIQGVSKAIVKANENRIFVDFDPGRSKVSDLLDVVRGAGFTPGLLTTRLQVAGLYCAECVARVEDSLKAIPGVSDAVMNAVSNEVRVDYLPSISDLSLLSQAVENAGPYRVERAVEATAPEMDKEAQTMEREYRSLMHKWWFAAAVGLPTMILSYPWMFPILGDWFPRGSTGLLYIWYAMGIASLAVLVYSGNQFFIGAWEGLKHRSANMHTLITNGASHKENSAILNCEASASG